MTKNSMVSRAANALGAFKRLFSGRQTQAKSNDLPDDWAEQMRVRREAIRRPSRARKPHMGYTRAPSTQRPLGRAHALHRAKGHPVYP